MKQNKSTMPHFVLTVHVHVYCCCDRSGQVGVDGCACELSMEKGPEKNQKVRL